jgi:hypothetical protein
MVKVSKMGETIARILRWPGFAPKSPSDVISLPQFNNVNNVLQSLEYSRDEHAMRPGTGGMHIEDISSYFSGKFRVRICRYKLPNA